MNLLKYLHISEATSGNVEKLPCYWCGKKSLSISAETPHTFQCFSCKKTGNGYTLLTGFWESLAVPTEEQIDQLLNRKPGIAREVVESTLRWRDGEWWFPVLNSEAHIICLYHWNPGTNIWYSSPAPFSCTVFGQENLKPGGTIWIPEGHWDYLAFLSWWKGGPVQVLGCAGSSFPRKYLSILKDRDIISLNDNDESGQNGINHLAAGLKTSGKPKSFLFLNWDSVSGSLPDGFDLRDYAVSLLEEDGFLKSGIPARLKSLKSHCRPINWETVQTVKPRTCRSFEELIQFYTNSDPSLAVSQSFRECLALCIAVHVSIQIGGDPLWMYLVSPPSGGKTTLLEQLAADEIHTVALSKFTGMVSGDRHGTHLAPRLKNRCLIVKDGTLLLEGSQAAISSIFGELRDIYDGSLVADYRNGRSAEIKDTNFSMLMGITEAIYGINTSMLGERFLHARLEVTREEEFARSEAALDHIFSSSKLVNTESGDPRSFPVQKAATAGFLQHIHSKIADAGEVIKPTYSQDEARIIQAMADVVACSRAHHENELFDTRPESSTRVVKQLGKLALCLCYVLDTKSISGIIMDLLLKVCIDSSWGQQFRIINLLVKHPEGLNRQNLAMLVDMPLTSMERRLKSMERMKLLEVSREETRNDRGRKNIVLQCPAWVRESWELSFPSVRKTSRTSPPSGTHTPTQSEGSSVATLLRKVPAKRKPSPAGSASR